MPRQEIQTVQTLAKYPLKLKAFSGWVYRVLQHSAGPYGPYEGVLHMAGKLCEKLDLFWEKKIGSEN